MNHKELEKMIDEVLNTEAAQTTLDIYKYIGLHRTIAQREAGKFIKYFEDFFDELNIAIQYLNFVPKKTWEMHKSIQYLLYPEAMKTLHRAFEDTIDGYYDEAMMLLRSVYETSLRILFLSCYPKEWEAIFFDRKNKMNFKVTGFAKDHLKLDWDFIYRIMSKIHHSKVTKNLSSLIRRSKPNTNDPIIIEYRVDKELLWMAINFITFNLCCLFHVMMSIFKDDFDKHDNLKVRMDRLKKIDQILLGLIEANPKEKFASLAKDLKKVGKIIKYADSGKDWKKIV
ncbi:MAG: hypothetical protein ACRENW_02590 [Thermodesulfobacteriota bacterium]